MALRPAPPRRPPHTKRWFRALAVIASGPGHPPRSTVTTRKTRRLACYVFLHGALLVINSNSSGADGPYAGKPERSERDALQGRGACQESAVTMAKRHFLAPPPLISLCLTATEQADFLTNRVKFPWKLKMEQGPLFPLKFPEFLVWAKVVVRRSGSLAQSGSLAVWQSGTGYNAPEC